MPHVTVGHDYFQGELRSYRRWEEAFTREVLQNAVDAGATQIRIDIDADTDTFTVTDNGCGMTRQVLSDVFFEVGRSGKATDDSTTIGGFGRARVILCFAQRHYRIRTGTLEATGTGGHYEITDGHPHVNGCQFTIGLLPGSADRVARHARMLLRRCDVAATVVLDGTTIEGTSTPARARRRLRTDDGRAWARVYVMDGAGGYLRVRVRGVQMYDRPLSGYDDVIVELDPSMSRQVLVGARESLAAPFDAQLDSFVSELQANRSQALKETVRPVAVRVTGGGMLTVVPPPRPSTRPPAGPEDATDGQADATHPAAPEAPSAPSAADLAHAEMAVAAKALTRSTVMKARAIERTTRTGGALPFDTYMWAGDSSPRVSTLLRRWDPARFYANSRRRQLLMAWTEAVRVAVTAMQQAVPSLGPVSFATGWVFDDDIEASCRAVPGGHVVSLNPVGSGTSSTFRVSDRADRWRLITLAAHEVAHILVSGHDEAYANALTDIVAELDPTDAIARVAAAAARR